MDMTNDVGTCTLTYESAALGYSDFPLTEEPVYLLGIKYSALYDRDDLKKDFLSRIWCTYRKNFPAIGGTGPTSDAGWGCMLRCGQMMLAQALVVRHLGRDWRWNPNCHDESYKRVLQMFADKKSANYSIQQIASMGVSEGKQVGSWFGPNTVAQVLKKLAVYDEWSSLVIHIAMDNTVIENDIRSVCKGNEQSDCDIIGVRQLKHNSAAMGQSKSSSQNSSNQNKNKQNTVDVKSWKPLLLVIPLRLGLTEINSVYVHSLKACLSFPQSVGIIGGKPNHAHWFIGYMGDKLIYLDPHTTQPSEDLDSPNFPDDSYHCPFPSTMNVMDLDPSIALGFYCGTEKEFDDLTQSVQKFVVSSSKNPMFELYKDRPHHWPPYEPYTAQSASATGFTMVDGLDTEEEFELIG
ncbi:cysteine protease ATG4B-like [Saccostrea echinata]|uniref:cysteine protease ATG4B-like n=1 Tax=Saccostrea echinata TaxID=191078 RepID=UPI002A7FD127|nr:cysteine protease ATG4B-like [Saccostrea echinata]